jgi:hypothetical protein
MTNDPRVDNYISKLPVWQQSICQQVREIASRADPGIQETIKRSVQPYYVLDGNVCALLAAKSHVNIFIYDPLVEDPDKIINQGHGNLTARSIQVGENDKINEKALLAMFKAVIASNRMGGWRTLKKQ